MYYCILYSVYPEYESNISINQLILMIIGSVGHHRNLFSVHFLTVSLSTLKKNYIFFFFFWVSGSPPMLYKLVLGPAPILHTLGILIHFNDNWVSWSPPKSFSVHFLTMSAYPHILKKKKLNKKIIIKKN